jgi:hypothetical protein
MPKVKEFNPKKSIDAMVNKLRTGRYSKNLKDLSDEDLFGIVLDCYELGSNDTRDAIQVSLFRPVLRSRNVETRIAKLSLVPNIKKPKAAPPRKE